MSDGEGDWLGPRGVGVGEADGDGDGVGEGDGQGSPVESSFDQGKRP
jgi:hypothetical protein